LALHGEPQLTAGSLHPRPEVSVEDLQYPRLVHLALHRRVANALQRLPPSVDPADLAQYEGAGVCLDVVGPAVTESLTILQIAP
jgi:hypothetical protein